MAEGISLAEQGSIAKEFLEGLLASMNIQAEITVKELDEETVELSVNAIRRRSWASSLDHAARPFRHCKR
jgi:predicted RNA-binding protein Jag